MPWAGVVLWKGSGVGRLFCVQFDAKRQDWELPKGRFEARLRYSSGVADSSLFATARWELWEEAGVWLSWRSRFLWVDPAGRRLKAPPRGNAWVVTSAAPEDEVCEDFAARRWMTLVEFERHTSRRDHVALLTSVASLLD